MLTSAMTSGITRRTPPIFSGRYDPNGITANVVSAGIIVTSGAAV